MSAATVADLLADLLAPPANACPGPTPAKAANPANREHPCGLSADSALCEPLRISANPSPPAPEPPANSQTFAGIRKTQNGPDRKQWRGFSQDSQDSQGHPGGEASAKAPDRPYSLPKAAADAAHAEPWGDAAIVQFQARAGRFLRMGFRADDADDLAERLHLRDVHADYRHLCLECRHYRPHRCGNHKAADLQGPDVARDLATLLQDCRGFAARGDA